MVRSTPRATRTAEASVRRRVAAAVVDVCRDVAPGLPAAEAVRDAFVEAVRHHRVAPLAHIRLRGSDEDLAAELKIDRDSAMIRHLTATVVLGQLGRIIGEIPWATFKGPVLSEHAHPAKGLRTYTDVDVVVSPSRLREVTSRLLDSGWKIIDYRDMLCNPQTPGEMHWVGPTGVLIDLHWSMINMSQTRRRYSVDTDGLLDRRVSVPVGGSPTWTLDPADSLVHVGLHAALTGAHRMLLILDADQLARGITDWDAVVARARSWRAAPALALVLARARTLLDTPVPGDIDRSLGTSAGFRLVTSTVDHLVPVPRLRQEASLARLVARSVRGTGSRTLATAGRRGLRGLSQRAGLAGRATVQPVRQPADLDALETYLRMVEANAGAAS